MFSPFSPSAERECPAFGVSPLLVTDLSAVEQAILHTVVYADIFGYPLTAAEIHRYLVGMLVPPSAVYDSLSNGRLVPHYLAACDGFFTLSGRETLVEIRRSRGVVAALLWSQAVRYGTLIAHLPFVRMVAITGALAVNNVEPGADIDYLIVTEPGRLWLCRILVIAVVRLAALRGQIICPNYFLSEAALVLSERNLFTAHEVAQMVPIAGLSTYHYMRHLNTWVEDFLPNAGKPPERADNGKLRGHFARALTETALRTPVWNRLERWEMNRKVCKFTRQHGIHAEAAFCADRCKGHFDGHGQRILAAFANRLRTLEQFNL